MNLQTVRPENLITHVAYTSYNIPTSGNKPCGCFTPSAVIFKFAPVQFVLCSKDTMSCIPTEENCSGLRTFISDSVVENWSKESLEFPGLENLECQGSVGSTSAHAIDLKQSSLSSLDGEEPFSFPLKGFLELIRRELRVRDCLERKYKTTAGKPFKTKNSSSKGLW